MTEQERNKVRVEYVRANLEVFTLAYNEYQQRIHTRHKHRNVPTNYTTFVNKARKELNYSTKSSAIDIWLQFMVPPVLELVTDMKRRELRKKREVSDAIHYVRMMALLKKNFPRDSGA